MLKTETGIALRQFFDELIIAPQPVLVLDYDGVVGPYGIFASKKFAPKSVLGLLDVIMTSCRTRVAVVTDRDASRLLEVFRTGARPEIWGSSGFEKILPDGRHRVLPLDDASQQELSAISTWIESNGFKELTDLRAGRLEITFRDMPEDAGKSARACALEAVAHFGRSSEIVIYETGEAIEIRIRRNNVPQLLHAAVGELVANSPLVYLGPDTCDPANFRAVKESGLAVLVSPSFGDTDADVWLCPPDEFVRFLEDWIIARG